MRRRIANKKTRNQLNLQWHRNSFKESENIYLKYAKLFRDNSMRVDSGRWPIQFRDAEFSLPIRPDQMWLDWDLCLSVLGHEIEIKQTYANLLDSELQFDLMVDVGANYGTHSALFLANGLRSVLFEPNPHCLEYIEEQVQEHEWPAEVHACAVGDSDEPLTIHYPQFDTWLGRISDGEVPVFETDQAILSHKVKQVRLDDWCDEWSSKSILLKIDTEGHELNVLKGGRRLLEQNRSWVLFESWKDASRSRLLKLFDETGYDLHSLPYDPRCPNGALSANDFLGHPEQNFLAIPR